MPLKVFTHKNFAADIFRQKLHFTRKNSILCQLLGT